MHRIALACVLSLAAALPAQAAFHLMLVSEVYGGSVANPDAQYVELVMYANGQNFVSGHEIEVFDGAGVSVGVFTFSASVPTGTNQSRIFIATAAAEQEFNLQADLLMTAVIPSAGGKVCFPDATGGDDCVSWGNYSGAANDSGTPNPGLLGAGQGLVRRNDLGASATNIDNSGDDTDNSAVDWALAAPSPDNNSGNTAPPAEGEGEGEGEAGCLACDPDDQCGAQACLVTPGSATGTCGSCTNSLDCCFPLLCGSDGSCIFIGG